MERDSLQLVFLPHDTKSIPFLLVPSASLKYELSSIFLYSIIDGTICFA